MIAIIANPKALRFNKKEIGEIQAYLNRAGIQTDVFFTHAPGEATQIALKTRNYYRTVVAYGGDGTVNEVANGLLGSSTFLGILPAGTTTVIAMELGIPRNPKVAATFLINPRTKLVHPGTVNGRAFMLMCGIGFDARAVKMTTKRLKKLGKMGYVIGGLKALKHSNGETINLESGEFKSTTAWLIVSKSQTYGAGFSISHMIDISTKALDACFTNRKNAYGVALSFIGLALNSHNIISRFSHIITDRVTVETPGIPIQVDGDYIGTTPCRITIHKRALRVIVP